MAHKRRRGLRLLQRSGAWAVCAAMLCTLIAASASALEVRVRAKSVLDASVSAAGTVVRVSGSLRDELDRGLPQRQIHVYFVDTDTGTMVPAQGPSVHYTNRRGGFSAQEELEPGTWRVEVTFDETDHVTASQVTETIEVSPAPADLRIQVPRLVVGKVVSVPVRIRASAGGIGLQATAHVQVNDVDAGQVKLDQFGRGTVDVSGSLSPGLNDVSVRIPAARHREAAEKTETLRAAGALKATAEFGEVIERLRRGLAVEGQIADERGPLAGVRVAVRIRREGGAAAEKQPAGDATQQAGRGDNQAAFERFVTTDKIGRFRAFYDGGDLQDGVWRAETTVMPELGEQIALPTEPVELDRATSRWVLNALGLVGLLVGIGLIFQRLWQVIQTHLRRRQHERDSQERSEQALRDTEQLGVTKLSGDQANVDESPSSSRLSGLVWDIWQNQPVADAELLVHAADGDDEPVASARSTDSTAGRVGAFRVDELERGSYVLEIRAAGFMPATLDFRIPHRGRLSNVRLDLVAVPLKIRRLYQSLVETLDGKDLWGKLTPREIEMTLLEVAEQDDAPDESPGRRAFVRSLERQLDEAGDEISADELVAMMTTVVEQTYFSGRTFGIDVWELARDIALRLRARFREASV